MSPCDRFEALDMCSGNWKALFDCLNPKTRCSFEVQESLETREKAKSHICRTPEEASWKELFGHLDSDE
ncbi:DUF3128 domain-containing protein [Quillaja saponaria]|nr:DUF3128 domain-containing protein [Quillaja saponaria]